MRTLSALRRLAPALVVATLLCSFAAPALHAQGPYKVLDHWKLPDPGGWDYLLVDSPAHRVYITRGDHVDAIDSASGKLLGTIGGLHGTHGVALNPDGKTGYISDGRGNAVIVFDRSTFAITATIPAGTNPDAIIWEPATKSVWAFNGRSNDITVIDADSRKVVATIPVPGKPEFAVSDGKGNLYNNIEDKNEIVKIDVRQHKITATWPACESPSGLALDPDGNRLFAVCDGKKMAVLDANSGKILATPAIGDGPDAAGYSVKNKLAFASCGEGVLSVIDASGSDYKAIQSLPTKSRARTMTYDPATDRIYTVTADFGPPPAPTADNAHPRPAMLPGTFEIIVIGR
jgi:YVTN family beta-propeller protein